MKWIKAVQQEASDWFNIDSHRANSVWDLPKNGILYEPKKIISIYAAFVLVFALTFTTDAATLLQNSNTKLCINATSIRTPDHPNHCKTVSLVYVLFVCLRCNSVQESQAMRGKTSRLLFKVKTAVNICIWKPSDTRFLSLWISNKIKPIRSQVSKH